MEYDGSMGRVLQICEWVMRFAYTNFLGWSSPYLGLASSVLCRPLPHYSL